MAKKVITVFRLQIQAGAATPAPPIGPALGQHKLNIMQFVKEYNERTGSMSGVVPVEISVYSDRSFTFVLRTPPAGDLIKEAIGIEKGTGSAGAQIAGRITREQLQKIAQTKMKDLNTSNLEAAVRIIEGTARSMGVLVSE